jgi:hypothetical protein
MDTIGIDLSGQDRQNRTDRTRKQNRTDRTRKQSGTGRMEKAEQDFQIRTGRTGQAEQGRQT